MKHKNIKTITAFLIGLVIISGVTISCNKKKNKEQDVVKDNTTASITGSILGNVNGHSISMTEINEGIDNESIDTISTVSLKDGKFSFDNIKVDDPRAVKLTFGDTINTVVFLEPGTINVEIYPRDTIFTEYFTGTEVRSKRSGTINNVLFTQYRDQRHKVLTSPEFIDVRALDKTSFALYTDFDLLNKQMRQFKSKSYRRDSILIKIKKDFIIEHKDKMVSPYIVLFEDYRFDDVFETKEIIDFFDAYDKSLDGNRYYESMERYVTASRNTAIGITLADFALKNRNGETISLSSFRDKYVLIDFWAYWCTPCIAAFPHLEKLREKYKAEDFEILGISSDPNHEQWIKALDKHKPSWTQVIDNKEKTVSKQFNIAKLPTTFLVDKEGKVMAIDLYAEDLDNELETIFGH
ncbi:TlpA disulfide reductase family protein [Flavivirga abyssicola]|uniref:TlpA disulfide reductase family protein n=1 Tax=Flavivirga abyssicola TaxID=3063533 RepID=UPI0026DF0243|nr:TlpA disulfide reductase family protein [Flavivirga sp. MEBiC07777]WVK14754.1 TlpA disulfide reductase family protein [Flavivirga sp. MEBiC07777]